VKKIDAKFVPQNEIQEEKNEIQDGGRHLEFISGGYFDTLPLLNVTNIQYFKNISQSTTL